MATELTIDNFLEGIFDSCGDRYEMINGESIVSLFGRELAASKVGELAQIAQLKRKNQERAGRKTIIVAMIDHLNSDEGKENPELEKVITLAAYLRDALAGTEPYDLYLVLATHSPPNIDVCMRLESTEQFCKKYVLRADQSIAEMLERTFLCGFEESEIEGVIEDPLDAALKAAGLDPDKQQAKWRDAFLSGKMGDNLIDELFGTGSFKDENE